MKRLIALSLFIIMVACGGSSSNTPTPATVDRAAQMPPRSVLVVSIDGLRDDYLRDKQHAIPNLRKLAQEGSLAHSLVSVWPSVTYPAHATLVTGVNPSRHGIINNVLFDPLEKNDGGWFWYARDLRVEPLWDAAKRAGIDDVANITWPVTVGANIKWSLPQFWRAKIEEDEKLLCPISTPGLCDELHAANLHIPGEHRPDRDRAMAAAFILRTKKPRLTFAYMADLDTVEHQYGPGSPMAWAALERADVLLGYMVAEARANIPRLAVVVVSDHGFVPVERDVRPNVALRWAGLLESKDENAIPPKPLTKDAKVVRYRAVTWKSGGTAVIVGEPSVKAEVVAIFSELAKHPNESGIAQVIDGSVVEAQGGFPYALAASGSGVDPRTPSRAESVLIVLQAAEGATFSERQDEPMVAWSKYKGMHGHAPTLPNMGASLILAGDGIKQGAELGDVPMVDVAPTVAALLGFTLPSATGHPLRSALSD